MTDKAELEQAIYKARQQLSRIENKERYGKAIPLLGKCFRVRNCYSCPSKPSDYWWLYRRVTRIDRDGSMYAFEFQTDKEGRISIIPNQFFYQAYSVEDHDEITLAEFKKAMRAMQDRVTRECADAVCVIHPKGMKVDD